MANTGLATPYVRSMGVHNSTPELKASASKGCVLPGTEKTGKPSELDGSASCFDIKHTILSTLASSSGVSLDAYQATQVEDNMGFQAQSGLMTLSNVLPDDILNIVENFLAFCASMADCRSTRQAAAIIFLYAKTHYHVSIAKVMKEFLLENEMFTSSDLDIAESDDCLDDLSLSDNLDLQIGAESWISLLGSVKNKWSLVRKAPAFGKISKLLSMFAALGLCDLAKLNVDVAGIRIFSIPTHQKHVNAIDFATACLDTIEYFIRGGYECFVTKSFNPLLFENLGAQQFEEEFFKILEYSGAAKCGNLEKLTDMNENDYAALLEKIIDQSQQYLQSCPAGFERKVLADRHALLRKLRMDFNSYRVSGKMRVAPFGVYLHGSSGVGKSYISALICRLILKMNGFDASDDRFMVLNEADKFLSTAKSSINCIVIDDIGNAKPDFVEKAPTQKIIELCNNVPYYANMAEVDQKGKISLEPKCVMMTSNIEMCRLADTYSRDVMSIVRRANLHIGQSVRAEFCIDGTQMLDSAKVRKAFGDDPYPDAWLFHVQIAVNQDTKVEMQTLDYECSLPKLIKLLQEMTSNHFENQQFVVENSYNLAAKLDLCDLCHLPSTQCQCKQAGIMHAVCVCAHDSLMNYVPDCVFRNPVYQFLLSTLNYRFYLEYISQNSFLVFCIYSWCMVLSFLNFASGIAATIFCSYLMMGELWKKHTTYISEIALTRGQMPSLVDKIKEHKMKFILGSCAALGVLYSAIKIVHFVYQVSQQGSLRPSSEAEVNARDAEANPWIGAYVSPVPQQLQSSATHDQLNDAIEKNLCYLRLPQHPQGVACCDAFFIKSNLAIVPDHMWYADTMLAEFYSAKAFDNVLGESVRKLRSRGILSKTTSYHIPGTDFRIVYVPSCGTWKDFTPHLPDGKMNRFGGTMIYRDIDGDVQRWKVGCEYVPSMQVGDKSFECYKYTLPEETFKGLCIATIVSDTKPSLIAGFHLGGRGKLGVAGMITKAHIIDAEDHLRLKNSVLIAHSEGDLPTKQYDVQTFIGPVVHRNSCVNHLSLDNSMKVYGSTIGRSTYRSDVIKTPISDDIDRIMGIPNEWGPPKFHPWKPFFKSIQTSSNPSIGVDPLILEIAVHDYSDPLLKEITKPYWKKDVKPLTNVEILCGIDGKRFVDKMPPNTAIGFPLTGPKKKYMTALDPELHPDHMCPMEIEPRFWEEVDRIEELYSRGIRAYPVFKASLKDEPTKLTKDKVRVFYAAPFALQALIRKYYLPLCRFISMNPLLTECCVGINSQGPEWDELVRHMKKFGDDRILAGDYSTFDINMAAQFSLATWHIFVLLAKATGNYSDRQIMIMEGLATDCCYPTVAFNGDLVEFSGIHISGINLTAYVGSVDNSLLQRCCYFAAGLKQKKKLAPYRSKVAVGNYGDDFKGSVSESVTWFNHIVFRDYLAAHDMKLTMPDKASVATEFMTDKKADFLKRHNVYNEELDMYFGALDKKSIYKSLHAVIKSKAVTPRVQSAMNIDGGLREMFAHGRDEYEAFRAGVKKVAEANDLQCECLLLDETYDDRMKNFRERYLGDEAPPEDEPDVSGLSFQGGFEPPEEDPGCDLFPLAVNCLDFQREAIHAFWWERYGYMLYLVGISYLFYLGGCGRLFFYPRIPSHTWQILAIKLLGHNYVLVFGICVLFCYVHAIGLVFQNMKQIYRPSCVPGYYGKAKRTIISGYHV